MSLRLARKIKASRTVVIKTIIDHKVFPLSQIFPKREASLHVKPNALSHETLNFMHIQLSAHYEMKKKKKKNFSFDLEKQMFPNTFITLCAENEYLLGPGIKINQKII